MLADDGEEIVRSSDVKPFTDPALRSRRSRTKLAAKMYAAGLLKPLQKIRGHVSPFTVVKKVEDGVVTEQRLVLDQRRDNLRWRKPPWAPMASPGLFPFVRVPETAKVRCLVGDLPDMYWTLLLSTLFAEFFCLEEVVLSELSHALIRDYGIDPGFKNEDVAVGMQVPLMGWNWAVFLAQTALEDILEGGLSVMKASTRLQYKVQVPQFGPDCSLLHWEYVDDVGVMLIEELHGATAEEVGTDIRTMLQKLGLGFHKDAY